MDTTTGEDFLLAENGDFLVAEEPDLNDYSLLQEDGDQILQEDDDPLLLEANNAPRVIVGKLVLQTGELLPISLTRRLCCVGQTMAVTLGATSIGARWVRQVSGATASFGVALA
jgi:hypothetical protein